MKECNTCHVPKENSCFRKTKSGYRDRCKSCTNKIECKRIHDKCKDPKEVAKRTKWHRQFADSDEGHVSIRKTVIQRRAKSKGLEFDLDIEWFKSKLDTNKCEITGLRFDYDNFGMSPSVDRIDQTKGYIKSNCRMILYCVNAFRGTMNDTEMIKIASTLVQNANV